MTQDPAPAHGTAVTLAPGIVRVIAPNPSPMTYWGTNSFVLGEDRLVVIDPGPAIPAHLDALLSTIAGRSVTHILVTHSHLDHSPLARPLAEVTGAPVCAFGPSSAGRSAVMQSLATAGLMGGGEGIDAAFQPDATLQDGDQFETGAGVVTALHTPGHIGNHLCFEWGDALFCGDHVMGWASSLVSPPDGDLGDFLASTHRLTASKAQRFYPAHGVEITDPRARLRWLIDHRMSRSREILAALEAGPANAAELTAQIYQATPKALWPAAERNVLAHLLHLSDTGQLRPVGELHKDAVFRRDAGF